jgi:hypothetical protein
MATDNDGEMLLSELATMIKEVDASKFKIKDKSVQA